MNVRLQNGPVDVSPQPHAASWSLGAEPEAVLLSASNVERLEYLCDMLGELRTMAEQSSLRRLAVILALAHEEAQQQRASR